MPVLPTVAEVVALTNTSLEEAVVASLINDAALIAGSCLDVYDSARQTAIIKWLAAHLVASTSSSGVLTSDKLGDAAQTFSRATVGEGLNGTMYGQQALALDTKGCLTRRGKAPASVQVI